MKRTTKFVLVPLVAAAGLSLVAGGAALAFGQSHGHGQFERGEKLLNAEFADFDLDGNGLITIEDLKAQADARFAAADTDGDGKLSMDELTAAAQARMAERMATNMAERGGMGQSQGQHQGRMGAQGPDMEKRLRWMTETMLDRRDADGDGFLSRAELQDEEKSLARMERMIDRFDTDDDNAISAAEFDEAQKQAWLRGRQRDGDRRSRR